jgi:hypothetical protein
MVTETSADQGIDGICGLAAHYCGKPLAYRGGSFPSSFNGSGEPDAIGVRLPRTKRGSKAPSVPERHSLSAIMGGKAAQFSHSRFTMSPIRLFHLSGGGRSGALVRDSADT